MEVRSGNARSGSAENQVAGFQDGIDGVGSSYSSFVPRPRKTKNQ
jgi:hypothetical protein